MDRYVVERTLPGAGSLSEQELHDISAKSNEVLAGMDDIAWVESYVTDDKLYCVYEADDPAQIEQHAAEGGFPCDRVSAVRGTISPESGR
ncbi:hypothetical protein GCM10011519_29410 [Marmoricola endophyticus]|uniref:DUF4242 domain-containing protein n=1 Tax=Marmoricola endophyticus TaxID=2040280 RepID=A0A917BRS8_9ACTN|nr:DUF4242 domain-containing protein [Marmoricola endophyticus]GGF53627.1 hypothetical protein GCM10011519_29410 [Marmoricola endophyticus]